MVGMAKTVESEFYRRRRNFVIDQLRDAFRGIRISEARAAPASNRLVFRLSTSARRGGGAFPSDRVA